VFLSGNKTESLIELEQRNKQIAVWRQIPANISRDLTVAYLHQRFPGKINKNNAG
jgi:hypothetical protein